MPFKTRTMGSEFGPGKTQPFKSKRKGSRWLTMGTVLMLIIFALTWNDVIEFINGEPQLTVKHQQQLQKKLNELEEAEQYALIATKEGYYPCLHSDHALYFLHIGEVWKYGVTTKGERGRYTSQFILDHSVKYVIQSTGSIDKCLKEEQVKLFSYPMLPENLARLEKDRLIRPPFNPIFN